MSPSFDFGENWKSYSKKALDEKKFEEALGSLKTLFQKDRLEGLSFLDIGCGSGIFSIAARKLGASPVVGIDISRNSVEAAQGNAERFGLKKNEIGFFEADILDKDDARKFGQFDLVYAWGSLHHTGRMWEAIDHASQLVMPGGIFVLGIYRKHFTSPGWKIIKRIYNGLPFFVKRLMIWFFYPVILTGIVALTRKNPFRMRRGMDLYHDVVDWIGGYPYEYASCREVTDFLETRGFYLERFFPTEYLLGNHEYVFMKKPSRGA